MAEDEPTTNSHGTDRDMLIRIDERTQELTRKVELMVTRSEFESKMAPIRMVVYGLVGLLMAGVVGALLAQILK